MAEILVEVTRGPIVESRHYGDVAVCNGKGELIAYKGDPEFVTYIRSACKPIQALNRFCSGSAEKWVFTQKEYAIMCSSHYGEPMHQEVILELLDKIGCTLDDLQTGTPYSIRPAYYEQQLREHHVLKPYNSDCSGKHCGFLSDCIASGYPTEGYTRPDHPVQKDVLRIVSEVADLPAEQIAIGIDGCSVPVHGMPLHNMAKAYARFSTPENLPEKYRRGAKILADAMNAEPDMLAGPGGFCTEFLRATHGRFVGKLGAEAVYCVGVRGRDLGIAVKIEDGNMMRPLYPAVMSVLDQLGLLSDEEKAALKQFTEPPVINDHGWTVGSVRPVFRLNFTGKAY